MVPAEGNRMKLGLIPALPILSVAAAGAVQAEDDYSLFRMTTGAVIQMKTGEKGDAVRLLTNPQTMTIDGETLPLAPADAVWAPVPDGSYETTLARPS
jgi:hypothetical protein